MTACRGSGVSGVFDRGAIAERASGVSGVFCDRYSPYKHGGSLPTSSRTRRIANRGYPPKKTPVAPGIAAFPVLGARPTRPARYDHIGRPPDGARPEAHPSPLAQRLRHGSWPAPGSGPIHCAGSFPAQVRSGLAVREIPDFLTPEISLNA